MHIITNLKRKSIKETQVNLKVICPLCASFETHVKFVKSGQCQHYYMKVNKKNLHVCTVQQ